MNAARLEKTKAPEPNPKPKHEAPREVRQTYPDKFIVKITSVLDFLVSQSKLI